MKKNIKKIKFPDDASEAERYLGVIIEDIDSKMDLLFEGFDSVRKELGGKIDDVQEDLNSFKTEMRGFKTETRNNFKTVFQYLSRIDEEIQFIKSEIADLKDKLDKKADIERLEKLEKRVNKIEIILAHEKGNI